MCAKQLPLTGLLVGEVSPAVLVCGDPARASKMAAFLENATLLSERREYRAFRGDYAGIPVTICSHGIGAPGAAIAFEELIAAGGTVMIRVGTCGGLQPAIQDGDLVISTGAVDVTGYGREAVPAGFPPVPSLAVSWLLYQTACQQQERVFAGLGRSRGQVRLARGGLAGKPSAYFGGST